ncbi:peroxiredoxin-like family protein [Abditibacterium utsteinense]|nr:peroxiredoxin-like family protein [Abditibacterium utsteinense]
MLALALATPMLVPSARAQSAMALPAVAAAPNDVSPLKIGLKVPEISLLDSTGTQYELTKSLANGPAILVFYRGGWCPYCNTQLAGLSKIEPKLLKMGYRVFAISPDSPAELSKTVDKHKLPYKLLSDSKMEATRAMGLAYQVDAETVEKYKGYGIDFMKSSGGQSQNKLPIPAVYMVGSDGIVDFSYANPDYRTRVPEALILAAAQIFAPQK